MAERPGSVAAPTPGKALTSAALSRVQLATLRTSGSHSSMTSGGSGGARSGSSGEGRSRRSPQLGAAGRFHHGSQYLSSPTSATSSSAAYPFPHWPDSPSRINAVNAALGIPTSRSSSRAPTRPVSPDRGSERDRSVEPRSASTSSLRSLLTSSRSRRPSMLTGTSTLSLSTVGTDSPSTTSRSRLQSFLEGVSHTTRVRSPSLRGHSRRASLESSSSFAATLPPGPTRKATSRSLAEAEEAYLDDGATDVDDEVFFEGDRLEAGARHGGHIVTECQTRGVAPVPLDAPDRLRLEVVRQVGTGSYAVVYLARRVLHDPADDGGSNDDHALFDDDDSAFGSEAGGAGDRTFRRRDIVYGEDFALKCLSKRNLSDDMLEVQRFEATLMRKLPSHPNVVALHGVRARDE